MFTCFPSFVVRSKASVAFAGNLESRRLGSKVRPSSSLRTSQRHDPQNRINEDQRLYHHGQHKARITALRASQCTLTSRQDPSDIQRTNLICYGSHWGIYSPSQQMPRRRCTICEESATHHHNAFAEINGSNFHAIGGAIVHPSHLTRLPAPHNADIHPSPHS